jgi:hypothetical protein
MLLDPRNQLLGIQDGRLLNFGQNGQRV